MKSIIASLALLGGCALIGSAADTDSLNPTGKPDKHRAGLSTRYAVWHDARGWHVRATASDKELHQFNGTDVIFVGKKGEHPDKTTFTLPPHPGEAPRDKK